MALVTVKPKAMKILYLHGFAAKLNGRKASFLRGHFGPDSVIEPPAPGFPYGDTLAKPVLQKVRQQIQSNPAILLGLIGRNRAKYLGKLSPEMIDFFPRSVQIAQGVYDRVSPDMIVGSSLGGSVAMAMDSGQTPVVLIDPLSNRHVKAGLTADNKPAWGPLRKAFISLAIAAVKHPVAQLAGFSVPLTIKSQTIILHSPHDQIIDLASSRSLLRKNPIPAADPCRTRMDRVIQNLNLAGYDNRQSNDASRYNDGRLIVIGKDHHNNEADPNDQRNKDPHPHRALAAAICLLCEEFSGGFTS